MAASSFLSVGRDLARIYRNDPTQFEIFRKIAAWPRTGKDYLVLSPEETLLWQLEIEQLRHYLSEEWVNWPEREIWRKMRAFEAHDYGDRAWTPSDYDEMLRVGLLLCETSMEMNNPVEFLR